jgi:peptidoglycan/LPS O-acetylase OafA/YrhL
VDLFAPRPASPAAAAPITSREAPYRSDIDGLRAIAVLLVVGFHAFPEIVPGGFIGVDVFFVISGYLITGIILDAQRNGNFTFHHFYYRRIRRIFPALIVVLLSTYAVAWYLLLPDVMVSLGRNVFGGAAFSSNIVLLNEVSYFDIASDQKPLLHLWSLGVEEQFYIFWPLTLWLTAKMAPRTRLGWITWALLLASLALELELSASRPAVAFYLPITRMWEILSGAVLAMQRRRQAPALATISVGHLSQAASIGHFSRVGQLLHSTEARSFLGICLIATSSIAFDRTDVYPGWRALMPVLGTVLLISTDGCWVNRRLSSPLLVYVGLISYPLYLWHWPILTFARQVAFVSGVTLRYRMLAGAVAASFVLASATYHLIEKPIRFGRLRLSRVIALSTVMAGIGALGLATVAGNGLDFRIPEAVRGAAHVTVDVDHEWRVHRCLMEAYDGPALFADSCVDSGSEPLVFLWGDSLAGSLYPGLREGRGEGGYRLAQFTTAGCPPVLGMEIPGRPHCKENNDFIVAAIARYQPAIVLLDSIWEFRGLDFAQIDGTIAEIRRRSSARIVMLGPLPQWAGGLPHNTIQYYLLTSQLIPQYSKLHLQEDIRVTDETLRAKAVSLGVEYVSLWDILCRREECLTRVGAASQDLTAFDDVHLTLKGSTFAAMHVMPLVLAPR